MTSERAGLQASLGALDSTLDDLRAISSTSVAFDDMLSHTSGSLRVVVVYSRSDTCSLGSMDEYFNSHGERVKFIRELPKLAERDIHDLGGFFRST